MSNCVFAFGEGGTYFMETPKMPHWAALPDTIKARFPNKGEDAKGSEISHVHNMVFGANGSYMLAWKGANGKNYEANEGLPADLTAWLNKKNDKGLLVRDLKNLKLALGPGNKSYFVTDGKDRLYNNLPTRLTAAIENQCKKEGGSTFAPRFVALGLENTYALATAEGWGSWDVSNQYPQLDIYLKGLKAGSNGRTFGNVSYISLSAFDATYFVIAHTNGSHYSQAPTEWHPKVIEVLKTLPEEIPKTLPAAVPKMLSATVPKALPAAAVTPKTAPAAVPKVVSTAAPKVAPTANPKVLPTAAPKVVAVAAPKVVPAAAVAPKILPAATSKVVSTIAPKVFLAPAAAPKVLPVAQICPSQAETDNSKDTHRNSDLAKMALNSFIVGAGGGGFSGNEMDGPPSVEEITANLVVTATNWLL